MDASGSQPGYQGAGARVQGRSLHDVLHDPGTGIAQQTVVPLDPSRVALIAHGVLTALASGSVHGYITPHTILLTDDGTALLIGDRVTPGATPANDILALGMALFEAVEGYAPHPAAPLPAMQRAGVLAPLIAAMTRREPAERPDAATALRMLRQALAAPATTSATTSPDATETRTLPRVPTAGSAPAAGSGDTDASEGTGTAVLPRIPAAPITQPMPSGPPDYSAAGYEAYEDHPEAKPRALLLGGSLAAAVVLAGVVLGVTHPWQRTDNSSSTVPGAPTATSAPTSAVAATPPSATATSASASSASSTDPASTTLVSMSLCLDAGSDGGGVKSGAKVSAATCQGSPNQEWQLHSDGTIHSAADASLCLDAAAPDGKVSNAAQVSAWTCHNGPNQQWLWNANGTVSPAANTALCLDASGPLPVRSGANVTAWPCNGGPNEVWGKR